MRRCSSAPRSTRPSGGFTLVEMLVAILVSTIILVALLGVFDFSNKLARAQTEITDVQQSLRSAQYDVVRLVRMAGRGPLPARTAGKLVPNGLAVEVVNNVEAGTSIGFESGNGPEVVPLSDVLVIRGVFGSSLYQINHVDPETFSRTPTGGTVTITDKTPTGVPQDLAPILRTVCDPGDVPEALVLVSPLDDSIFAVVELDPAASRSSVACAAGPASIDSLRIAFKTAGGSHTEDYLGLSPGGAFPPALTSAAFLGVLEEHRFYIRENLLDPDDPASRAPRFSRARVFPGSDEPYRSDALQWRNDVADNIFDLQVALGIDTNDDGLLADDGDGSDEWLFNHPADDAGEARWNVVQPATLPAREPRLYYLRLTTIARTAAADRGYQAPKLDLVEDHSYAEPPSDFYNLPAQRARRQRRQQTMVDMRNLS